MKIASVSVRNIFGIKAFDFEAGNWNEITGENGEGKTSLLNAIKAVVGGGSDATLLRNGEEKGEIVIVLDDRTVIKKRVGVGKGVTVEKDGVRQDKPQETINALRDMVSVNPVAFIEADPKARVAMFLESLPIKADADRIRSIIGDATFEIDEDASALEQIREAYKTIFSERRDTNRAFDQKEATINQLAQTLPADGAEAEDESSIQAELKRLDDAKDAEDLRIDTKLGGLKVEHEAKIEAKREEIAALQAQIATLQTEIASAKEAFAETQSRADGQRQLKINQWRAERQPWVDRLNLIQATRDQLSKAEATRGHMRAMRAEADRLKEDSERMTKALRDLEAYKSELLDTLPIPGLVVEDGVLLRDGVPFDSLNEAQQVQIAFELAAMRAGALKIACVDGIENLSTATYAIFKDRAKESGLQLFVTKVSDTPLQVQTS